MNGNDETISTAENYRRFARLEARGRSDLYEELAEGVAGDLEVLDLLGTLPVAKRQPNLFFGAVNYLYGTAAGYSSFRRAVVEHWSMVRATMLARRTQTNEVGRCATLLPLLAGLPQPLALFEVGASAGLCLLPDRYRYDYGGAVVGPEGSPVLLRCEQRGLARPVPDTLPEVIWRAGVDLAPVDVRDETATAWLEALVWPGEGDRLARLRAALAIARRDPPNVVTADLRAGLAKLVVDVPPEATLVVFHSAVLAYVPAQDRGGFEAEVTELGAVWISNEGASVLPAVRGSVPDDELGEHEGQFLLSRDGKPVAWADPHGSWFEWRQRPTGE